MLNVLLFIATYLGGYVLTIALNPAISFALYEAVYFFFPQNRWWGRMVPDISYSFFVVALMGLMLILNNSKLKDFKAFSAPQVKLAYVVLLLFAIAYYYAIFPDEHGTALNYFVKTFIIFTIALKLCDTPFKLDLYLYGYLYGAWYISFVAFQVGRNSGDRVEGIGTVDAPEANSMTAAIAPAIVIAVYYFIFTPNKYKKLAFAVAGVFIANAIVLINSRGSFLGTAVGITYFMGILFFSTYKFKHQKKVVMLIGVLGISGALYLADDGFIDRMMTMETEVEAAEERESGATRFHFWRAAWEMAKDHPFGNGWKGFNALSPAYIPPEIDTGGNRSRTVHSTWFEALTEIGYLGLIVFTLMIYYAWKKLGDARKHVVENYPKSVESTRIFYKLVALQAALITFVVCMTFINRMRAEILYWLILYSAIAYNIYVVNAKRTVTAR